MHDDLPILDELGADLRRAFRTRERRRRRRLPAAALAAAAAATFALVTGLDTGHVAPTAAEALRRAARAALDAPAPFPRADQYFYVHSSRIDLTTPEPPRPGEAGLVTTERRFWISLERPGHLEQRFVAARFPGATEAQRRAGEEQVRGLSKTYPLGRAHRFHLGDFKLTREQLLAFPTDPRTVYDRLRANVGGRGHSPDGEVFTEIGDALREQPAPAALRAGLYGALALIPGIELVGDVTDRVGRRGVAVAFTEIGVRNELIFDPDTSELLAERSVLLDPKAAEIPLPAGTVIGDSVYLERAVADELP
jgi:hypothetical protein